MDQSILTYITAGSTIVLAVLTFFYLLATNRIAQASKDAAEAALATAKETAVLAAYTEQAVQMEARPAFASTIWLRPDRKGELPGPWAVIDTGVMVRNLGRTPAMNIEVYVAIGSNDELRLFHPWHPALVNSITPENEVTFQREGLSLTEQWQAEDEIPVLWRVLARNVEGRKYVSTFQLNYRFTRVVSQEQELQRVQVSELQGELISCELAND